MLPPYRFVVGDMLPPLKGCGLPASVNTLQVLIWMIKIDFGFEIRVKLEFHFS